MHRHDILIILKRTERYDRKSLIKGVLKEVGEKRNTFDDNNSNNNSEGNYSVVLRIVYHPLFKTRPRLIILGKGI